MVVIVIIPILQRGKLRLREGKELGYLTGWNLGLETNSPVPQSGSACGPTRFSAGQSVRRAQSPGGARGRAGLQCWAGLHLQEGTARTARELNPNRVQAFCL